MANDKRYNFNLPTTLFEHVEQKAKDRDVSTAHIMRVFLRLGLEVLESNGKVFVVDDENREREVKILL